jgi:hypothetical protein
MAQVTEAVCCKGGNVCVRVLTRVDVFCDKETLASA